MPDPNLPLRPEPPEFRAVEPQVKPLEQQRAVERPGPPLAEHLQ